MALIKCSECGTDVSEKAQVCPKCGCPIEITKKIISEVQKTKNKKLFTTIIISIVLIASIIGIICLVNSNKLKSGLYNNIAWGTSIDEIEEKVNSNQDNLFEEAVNEDRTTVQETVSDYYGFENVTAMVTYDCEINQELHGIKVFIINGEDSNYSDNDISQTIMEDFDNLYGEHSDDVISKVWTTKKSKIALTYFAEGCLVLEYDDIATIEE